MSTIRGRIGQFQVLSEEQALLPHLTPTIRFTQKSFFSMFEKHGRILLKPVVGMQFITVVKESAHCIIMTQNKRLEVGNQALAYNAIVHLKENQNYVMQPIKRFVPFWRRPFHRLITLQERGGRWEMTHSTKITRHIAERFLFKLYETKIGNIACLAAKTLHAAYPKTEAIVMDISVNALGKVLIHDTMLHFSVSKWSQYQMIRPLMPKTDLFTEATLTSFLANYKTIFLKPCNGQQGRGIIKITRNGKSYMLHRGRKKRQVEQAQLMEHLKWNECYIIQQGIPLAQVNHAVFDIRVLLKKREDDWIVHRKAVKVAGDGYIVTNAAQAVLRLEEVLPHSTIIVKNLEVLNNQLNALCLQAARVLDHEHKRTIIGFDIAVTNVGDLFIIEGNYMPDLAMFHQLKPNASQ